jgi:hypothetical protein
MTESSASRLAPGASWSHVQEVTKGGEQRWSERGSRVRTEARAGGSGEATEAVGGGAGGAEGSTGPDGGAVQDARATRGNQGRWRDRITAGRIADARVLSDAATNIALSTSGHRPAGRVVSRVPIRDRWAMPTWPRLSTQVVGIPSSCVRLTSLATPLAYPNTPNTARPSWGRVSRTARQRSANGNHACHAGCPVRTASSRIRPNPYTSSAGHSAKPASRSGDR